MNRELRERLLLPFAVPVGSMVLIAILVFGVSRVLLAAPRAVAVAVALMLAVNILAGCAVVASRPAGLKPNILLVAAVALVPLGIGLVSASGIAVRPKAGEVGAGAVELTASNLAFDNKQLRLVANKSAVIKFSNRDQGTPHNLAIFNGSDATAARLFTGESVTGPGAKSYRLPLLQAGSFFFRCDFHPATMTGTIEVTSSAPEVVAAAPARASISANNLSFSTAELSVPADTKISLEFDNREAQPHNFAVFKGTDATGEQLFEGAIVFGPKKSTYSLPPLAAGTYFFRCNVHPTMKGTLRVG